MALFPIGAKVGADTSAFISSMKGGASALTAFTGAAGLAGGALSAFAGAAVMGAAISSAKEYQIELVKLNTLVGIQTEQIKAWDAAFKDLSAETGKAPADLARAMFAITSGGARGTDAMELLEQAAKASAIGLGDMTAIGRTATAMLQAFGDEGLTAEKAIDVLVATVREGNLEATSLAGAFSRVLGPAKKLGSSVEEIGAFLATFTRLGGSTEEAATGLLNVFNLLINATPDARKAMEKYGLSIQELRRMVSEEGLPAALVALNEVLGDNVDALGEVIPNTRALIGFLNTAGLQGEEFVRVFDSISQSLGLTDEGFKTWGDTAEATFTRFTASLKVAGIALGESLLPPLEAVLKIVTPLIQAIAALVGVTDDWVRSLSQVPSFELQRLFDTVFGSIDDGTQSLFELNQELEKLGLDPVDLTPFQEVNKELREMSGEERLQRQEQLRQSLRGLSDSTEGISFSAQNARRRQAELAAELVQVTAFIDTQTAAQERAAEATKESTAAVVTFTEEEVEAQRKREEAIVGIIDQLELEMKRLKEGEVAILDKQLAELGANDTTREAARVLFNKIVRINDEIKALKAAEREQAQIERAQTRRRETLRRRREREARSQAERKARAAQAAEIARLNNEMREAQQIAQETARIIGDSFNDIIDGTESVADAFKNMVTEILRQVQRLLIQRTIVEPIIRALTGAFGPDLPTGGGTTLAESGLALPGVSKNIGTSLRESGLALPGAVAGRSLTPTTVVQQNITFAPSFLDGADGARWLRGQSQEIMTIVGEGAQRSVGFSRVLRGGVG